MYQTNGIAVLCRPNVCFSNPVVQQKKTADGGTRKRYFPFVYIMNYPQYKSLGLELRLLFGRDNDLHKLLFMPNGLPDGAELAYYIKGQVFNVFPC